MSLFKRLLNPGKQSASKKKTDHGKYYPEEKLPIDEKFTYNFNKNGGKFLYCENMEEALESFDNILLENDWYEKDVFCINEQLTSRFDGFNLTFSKKANTTFFLSTCESLVANNGSILLSSNQMKEKKLHELPDNIVIFATTSQLVDTISEGLRIIKNHCKGKIPSNITTIQDFESNKEKDFMSYGSSTKNLYLLLLEDL
ncbi:MAG TPA: lactate utilization protein B/C [Flavobacteriaceae bacterium]|jgi:L-lactate utilization protein LutB|nr:lactate utilization protein B/C [Flavobacteriaceae bacterium]MAM27806.1 lactate utilization protein B/C [Flavobacteriaceae bacterium]MAY52323.1 lactate utilization protein B/C [Flavobacteriaceae bacterium]HBR54480.1 lactate utilization protein B/C [Flavobacteriaceae bacterium]HIB48898.1 lactate utilization protein B/C [Flavobacteriaceae bacterium]|tara:strand:+ start:1935 stop:2534 length:600 start_codon:yes stop_codon:yes gene_type:complete